MTQTRPRRRLNWIWLLLAVLLIGGATAAFLLRRQANTAATPTVTIETASATQGLFRVSVTGSGTLEASRTLDVSASVSGTIVQLPKVGDRVTKGQLLLRLDPSSYQRALENAQIAQSKAQTQLESARSSQTSGVAQQEQSIVSAQASYSNAQNTLASAQASLEASRKLFAVGGASQQALSDAQRSYEQAQANLQSAKVSLDTARQSLSLKQSGNTQDLRNLELAVQQAQINLRDAQQNLAKTKVFAPFDGAVSTVNGQVGANAAGNLLSLISDATVNLPVQIDETEIAKVKVGQAAEVSLDAIDGQKFAGKVIRISPAATTVQNIAVFYVTVALSNPQQVLRPGMTAEAEIISQEIPDAVQVPVRAVEKVRNRGYVQVQGETDRRRVRTGPDDGTNMVIVSGLKVSEVVILPAKVRTTTTQQSGGIRIPLGGGR